MTASHPVINELEKGMKVAIVEKHNQVSGDRTVGKIERILTNSESHPHGIKVMLSDGKVGRVKKILNEKDK